jgi:hypothetical protein
MDPFERIVETRLQEAAEKGLFDDLPGAGKPLELEDLSGVPAELRASYLVLKNAGYLPEEMQLRKEALRLEDLLAACHDAEEAADIRRELSAKLVRWRMLMERRGATAVLAEYRGAINDRLGARGR